MSDEQEVELKEHSDAELEGFIEALNDYVLARLVQHNVIHAKGAMPLDKATRQLKAYIQPLLCFKKD